ncbi:hypothetical protein HGRIS_009747 [Hohenbuehelia grisea]|uniref:Uncharacterized protein n=1 Tax=Hohenbuehelia grisea TaxID=104357 RepID=A0ABR3J2M1_9AGAR
MSPVAFLGGWRRKDRETKSQPYPRDSNSSSNSLLPLQSISTSRAAQSTPSLVLPPSVILDAEQRDTLSEIANNGKVGRSVMEPPYARPRTLSAGAMRHTDPFHGPPINYRHGPPYNASHGPPPRTPLILAPLPPVPMSSRPVRPTRPPRPPGLDLTISTDWQRRGADATPRVKFSIPSPINGSQDTSSASELDGVWQGFLQEAEGEFDVVDLYAALPTGLPESPRHRRGVSRHHLYDSDLSSPGSLKHMTARPSTSPNIGSAKTPRLQHASLASRSMTSLPRPEWQQPNSTAGLRDNTADTLSLFPAPPPLTIRRRKAAPAPLVLLPTPSVAHLPPSPGMITPDTTPVATPTTPRFSQSPFPHTIRKGSPGQPTSILKKRPATSGSSPTSIYSPSDFNSISPASSKQVQLPPVRPLRVAKSASHITVDMRKPAGAHRPTQSDSTALSRYPTARQIPAQQPPPLPPKDRHLPPSYLSSGRSPPRPLKHAFPAVGVEWGYAV